jgi:hypothetical protein
MVGIKEAVLAAKRFVEDLYADEEVQDIALEEIVRSDDGKAWHVTIGISVPRQPTARESLLARALAPAGSESSESFPLERQLKVVAVDTETGHVTGMRIRES